MFISGDISVQSINQSINQSIPDQFLDFIKTCSNLITMFLSFPPTVNLCEVVRLQYKKFAKRKKLKKGRESLMRSACVCLN